jgi:hypothetical protein
MINCRLNQKINKTLLEAFKNVVYWECNYPDFVISLVIHWCDCSKQERLLINELNYWNTNENKITIPFIVLFLMLFCSLVKKQEAAMKRNYYP